LFEWVVQGSNLRPAD